jgi:hypothetical protein
MNLEPVKNTFSYINDKQYHNVMELKLFDTRGLFDGIPDVRQAIHKQYIVMLNRWIFDVELSFEKMKFFIIIKRRLSLKPLTETDQAVT